MIDVYYAPTPNNHKITLFLEETGVPYQLHRLDISAGDQFKPAFLAISPNNKIPAIVDNQPAVECAWRRANGSTLPARR